MSDAPQLTLITPPDIDAAFGDVLATILDARPIACLRLTLASQDVDRITRAVDLCRAQTEPRDVALVITDHAALVQRLGLDGVHLTDPRPARKLRADWGDDPIIGTYCGASRHDGLIAGENGADYVAFGPAGTNLGAGDRAERDLFAWWSEMIEVPVIAEGGLDVATIEALRDATDFFALGEELWSGDAPLARLAALTAPLS